MEGSRCLKRGVIFVRYFEVLFTLMSTFSTVMVYFNFSVLLLLIGFPDESFAGAHEIGNQGEYVGLKLGSAVGADLAWTSNPNCRTGRESLFPFLYTPDREPVRLEEVRPLSFCSPVFSSLFLFSLSSWLLDFRGIGFSSIQFSF